MSDIRLRSPSNRLQIFLYLTGKQFEHGAMDTWLQHDAEWLLYLSHNLEAVYAQLCANYSEEQHSGSSDVSPRPARGQRQAAGGIAAHFTRRLEVTDGRR